MKTWKAVVLAGQCRGTEPWPSFGLAARQLAPVANKPILFHHLESLAGAGVREAGVLADPTTAAGIRDAVGDGSRWSLAISHLVDEEVGTALASRAVTDFAGSAPVWVQHGDALLRERLSALWDDFTGSGLDAMILRTAEEAGATIGCLVSPGLLEALAPHSPWDRRSGLDEALRNLQRGGVRVATREVRACLPCRGAVEVLLEANRLVLEDLDPSPRGERVFGSEIQSRVDLPPSAEVRDSLIRGPVTIGPRARIVNAYIGPYTSLGADVQVEGVEIEHSIVFDGARISFLGARLEGSVVGPHAHVARDFHVPSAVRLSVGARAHVALA